MKRFFSSKWFLIALAVLAVAAVVLVYFFAKEFFKPLLWTVLIVGAVWLLAEVGMRAWKKRKRKALDEGITAKEGIEDRKREWEGFQAELDKQKIDRYELPFYLLVGEPQSGKSVLLQNSDLHFPFGQNKLSGIGGTRGCDWWFTEEAVILDLAGRLFTHEGGVADQVEWEAFLDLLTNFRPICPANGILLVVPCDSLLNDSTDVSRQKANKIQAALLTLAKKLEAQLPIYLVLTKADKLFGFAESVHRLDAAKRHEMFGWSRGADKVDALFDMEEARGGFREIVARARILRGDMLGSARIPEALSEVDRMFAFPDELAALEEPLELYLRRVFTDSGLSDRLSFRGIYLTSGLQSGVPIARVCAQALGGAGEADMQALEGLFSKQRAYFIKDLVRNRVFGERGLVRPTKGRVVAAQKRAFIGYGVSALVALVSVIGGLIYLFSGGAPEANDVTKKALELSKEAEVSKNWPVPKHLEVLAAITDAVEEERHAYEKALGNSTQEALKQLYAAEFDQRLVPALRAALHKHMNAKIGGALPDKFDTVKLAANCAVLLLDNEKDFAAGSVLGGIAPPTALELAESIIPDSERECELKGRNETFKLKRAIELRKEYLDTPAICAAPADTVAAVEAFARKTLEMYDGCLKPGQPYQPENALGFLLAWEGVEDAFKKLNADDVANNRDIFKLMKQYADSCAKLETCKQKLDSDSALTWQIKLRVHVDPSMMLVKKTRENLASMLAKRTGITGGPGKWAELDLLETFIDQKFATSETDTNVSTLTSPGDLLGEAAAKAKASLDKQILIPDVRLTAVLDVPLERMCRAAPDAQWKLVTLATDIENGVRDMGTGDKANRAYLAKVCEVGRMFLARYPDWKHLADDQAATTPLVENELATGVTKTLADVRKALSLPEFNRDSRDRTKDFRQGIERLLIAHLTLLADGHWTATDPPPNPTDCPKIDPGTLDALAWVRGEGAASKNSPLGQLTQDLETKYKTRRQDLMLEYWKAMTPAETSNLEHPLDGAETIAIVKQIGEHFDLMKNRFGSKESDDDDGLDPEWKAEVQQVLIDRLQRHDAVLREYWTPEALYLQPNDRLSEVARRVQDRLSEKELEARLKKTDESTKVPNDQDAVLSSRSRVFKSLPDAGKSMDALRALRPPKDVRSVTKQTRPIEMLAESIANSPDLAKNGPELAKMLSGFVVKPLVPGDAPRTASLLYAQALLKMLQERMLAEVRALYEKEFRDLLFKYEDVIDALYVEDFLATKAINEEDIMKQLDTLLKKRGEFDTLRLKYNASEDTLGLFPVAKAGVELEGIWAQQQFLTHLQAFFLGKDGKKVLDGKVDVKLKPQWADNSIWNSARGEKESREWFFGPGKQQGEMKNIQSSSRNMEGKILEWTFAPDPTKSLKMRWRDSPVEKDQPRDLKLDVYSSLAPLLFVWQGGNNKQEDGSWLVEVSPENSKLRAPFVVSFGERDLPVQPKRLE